MPISLSTAVLEGMGLRPLSTAESISAKFHALHVYEIQGFIVGEVRSPSVTRTLKSQRYPYSHSES